MAAVAILNVNLHPGKNRWKKTAQVVAVCLPKRLLTTRFAQNVN